MALQHTIGLMDCTFPHLLYISNENLNLYTKKKVTKNINIQNKILVTPRLSTDP